MIKSEKCSISEKCPVGSVTNAALWLRTQRPKPIDALSWSSSCLAYLEQRGWGGGAYFYSKLTEAAKGMPYRLLRCELFSQLTEHLYLKPYVITKKCQQVSTLVYQCYLSGLEILLVPIGWNLRPLAQKGPKNCVREKIDDKKLRMVSRFL